MEKYNPDFLQFVWHSLLYILAFATLLVIYYFTQSRSNYNVQALTTDFGNTLTEKDKAIIQAEIWKKYGRIFQLHTRR